MKSVFQLEPNSRLRTAKENPLTHPEVFRPHFQEFFVYTGPESDDLDEDENQSVTENKAQMHSDVDLGSDMDSDLDSVDLDSLPSNPTPFPGKKQDNSAPTIVNSNKALEDLKTTLNPPRKTGRGYKKPDLDPYVERRLDAMKIMLNFYTNLTSHTYNAWTASSFQAAIALGQGGSCAKRLRQLNRQFISDRTLLPVNPFGNWNESLLVDEEIGRAHV